jgi:SulP family sulfate permease
MSTDEKPSAKVKFFQSLGPITRKDALRDAVAGFQLAAMNIPQALGYTKIAGTPVVTGFYTLLLPLAGFAAFGSSRYLVVAADSATAAILANGISPMAALGSPRYVALASLVALQTAVLLLIGRLLKLGFIADFLSRTVLVGFLTGVGIQVGIAVLGGMTGVNVQARRTVMQLAEVVRGVPKMHMLTPAISLAVLIVIFGMHRVWSRFPAPLLAVIGAIVASAKLHLANRGVEIIGPIAGGLPTLGFPRVEWRDAETLLPVAASCLVLIVAQSAATARIYAVRHRQALDEDADLLGLAAANLGAGLSGTFVVNGSPTQTAMVERSSGRSQIAQLATAATVALVLLFLTRPLEYLPRCVLSAIVFVIAVRLIDLRGLQEIWRESPGEFWLAMMTAVVVVGQGVERGIVLAVVVSLLRVVHHSYRPASGVLVRTEQKFWQSIPAVPGARTEPGLAIYRFGASLFYANAGRFADEIERLAAGNGEKLRWVIVDAEATTNMDFTAARVVRELAADLKERGVTLVFARVQQSLKADLDRHGVTEALRPEHVFVRLHDAMRAWEEARNKEVRK